MCEPECPADAIVPDHDLKGDEHDKWFKINAKYSEIWPVVTQVHDDKPTAEQAEEVNGIPNKYETMFSEKPGNGD